jgi:hypothetical protein
VNTIFIIRTEPTLYFFEKFPLLVFAPGVTHLYEEEWLEVFNEYTERFPEFVDPEHLHFKHAVVGAGFLGRLVVRTASVGTGRCMGWRFIVDVEIEEFEC